MEAGKAASKTSETQVELPRNWAAFIIVGLIVLSIAAAILLPLANHSRERAEPAKAFLKNHFSQVRQNPKPFIDPNTGEKPDAERRAAYEAIARSTSETMPWLPSVLGSEQAATLFCLEVPLHGEKDERVSVMIVQNWSDDKSSSSMHVTGISVTRTCDCGEDMGCILN